MSPPPSSPPASWCTRRCR